MSANTAALASDITSFKHYLQAERGLAKNSVLAYGRDLERFQIWVAAGGLKNYLQPTVRELSHFLVYCREENLAAPTVARQSERTRRNSPDDMRSNA